MCNKLNQMTPICIKEVDNEMECEVLTEIITIIWKVFLRTCKDKSDSYKIINNQQLDDLQLLHGCSHSLLLRCVLECLLTFFVMLGCLVCCFGCLVAMYDSCLGSKTRWIYF